MNKGLPPGWRVIEIEPGNAKLAEHLRYVKRVADELAAIPRIKREVPNTWQGKPIEELTQEEREEFHFSQQPESTKAALLAQKTRKPHEDIDYLLRPMPACIANPNATSLDELTSKRALDPQDIAAHNGAKQGRNQLGQSDTGSVDREKREKGIQAFTYSKPAELTFEQMKKLVKLEEIVNTPLELPTPGKPWWKKIFNKGETRGLTKEEMDDWLAGKN